MTTQKNFKQLDRSVRKQTIIDTAAELFHKKGYSSTSLDDVAKALGISKPALYHYVKNKNELLTIIYTQTFENIFMDTYEISNMDLLPDEKLRRIIRHHITNIIMKDLYMFSVFFSEENRLPKRDFNKIREEKRRYTGIIEKILEEGMSQGLFVKTDPRLQAYAIIGMCNWIYKWYKVGETRFSPEQISDYFIQLLEGGYLVVDEADQPAQIGKTGKKKQGKRNYRKEKIYQQIKIHSQKLTELIAELEDA
ncbi:MAG: TetR/AcrR family transcriptional regulator [Deltaproteobacteria bacterium]|jgi:AcrR family transcriptional regulator|nr:TetR/AcrR family transcriptional regulator [Deltaproteobacteria bacterium]MBT4091436.1 TetR/AcrR family transcriptional regulator [Deltaproteobacteria bacterium]MBT4265686.1 TetR/AcrR family transcriptional regulator [Deltaproteobacteria bacterium]MBT4637695.1 TetR/AcrR family transcriptional regulator [Deltaproteobacteria bacterium]MBT6503745.1 TetR/AcrR family transcriptional regulator [Deltaproteobacteria bacterium]